MEPRLSGSHVTRGALVRYLQGSDGYVFEWDDILARGQWLHLDGRYHEPSDFTWNDLVGLHYPGDHVMTPSWANPDLVLPEGL